jgi:hypothetical protein
LSDFVPPFVGHNDLPGLPSICFEGGCYKVGFTHRGGFVRQYLASLVSDALLPTSEMKKVPWHTPSIQLGPQHSADRRRLRLTAGFSGADRSDGFV